MSVNLQKCAIIGCGFVGAASAFSLMESGIFSEMVLLDANRDKAEGEAMDLSHGLPFARPMQIWAGDYDDVTDAAVILLAAGANQKPGETRLDLVKKNVAILKSIAAELTKRGCEGILLVAANPVDILTRAAQLLTGFPPHRVLGTGTVLDTARLKYLLGEHLNVDSRSVHAFIIGEHGDSELAVWSSANVSGVELNDFCELCGHCDHMGNMQRLYEGVRDSAYEIIQRKGATYYGIAVAVRRIVQCIVRDEHSVLPVSTLLEGQYGLSGICLGVPTLVGRDGAERVLEIPLDDAERENLLASARAVEQVLRSVEL